MLAAETKASLKASWYHPRRLAHLPAGILTLEQGTSWVRCGRSVPDVGRCACRFHLDLVSGSKDGNGLKPVILNCDSVPQSKVIVHCWILTGISLSATPRHSEAGLSRLLFTSSLQKRNRCAYSMRLVRLLTDHTPREHRLHTSSCRTGLRLTDSPTSSALGQYLSSVREYRSSLCGASDVRGLLWSGRTAPVRIMSAPSSLVPC